MLFLVPLVPFLVPVMIFQYPTPNLPYTVQDLKFIILSSLCPFTQREAVTFWQYPSVLARVLTCTLMPYLVPSYHFTSSKKIPCKILTAALLKRYDQCPSRTITGTFQILVPLELLTRAHQKKYEINTFSFFSLLMSLLWCVCFCCAVTLFPRGTIKTDLNQYPTWCSLQFPCLSPTQYSKSNAVSQINSATHLQFTLCTLHSFIVSDLIPFSLPSSVPWYPP